MLSLLACVFHFALLIKLFELYCRLYILQLLSYFATTEGYWIVMAEIDPYLGVASLDCVCSHGGLNDLCYGFANVALHFLTFGVESESDAWLGRASQLRVCSRHMSLSAG
ncbi:hypothetical protein Tco_1380046 [Tanacetum coccineum]